jgi:hypothetical protein
MEQITNSTFGDWTLEWKVLRLHIYNDIGKLVLRKPDDRAPAVTSTLPKALDAINSSGKARGHSHLSCLSCMEQISATSYCLAAIPSNIMHAPEEMEG